MKPTEQTADSTRPKRRLIRAVVTGVFIVLAVVMTLWGVLAVYYSNLPGQSLRAVAAAIYGAASIAILLAVRPFRRAFLVFLGLFAIVLVWWLLIPPTNEGDWEPSVAVLPYATIEGDKITMHNIRDFDYRSDTDFTVHRYDKTFDLSKLQRADLFISYWGPTLIAHTMLSFCFESDQSVCVSIVTRKKKGQEYSAIRGFFKQYELTYVVADERDVIRVRTNYRGENVYLWRLTASPEVVRLVFLDYLRTINSLRDRPEWYNALTSNCTTDIRGHTYPYAGRHRWNWRILANGHLDELLYERGAVTRSLPFAELKERCLIDKRAKAADRDPAFSVKIREGIP